MLEVFFIFLAKIKMCNASKMFFNEMHVYFEAQYASHDSAVYACGSWDQDSKREILFWVSAKGCRLNDKKKKKKKQLKEQNSSFTFNKSNITQQLFEVYETDLLSNFVRENTLWEKNMWESLRKISTQQTWQEIKLKFPVFFSFAKVFSSLWHRR